MREYMARKRALEKQVVRIETLKMTRTGQNDQKPDFSRCPHCFSKYVVVEGTVIRCRNCGIEVDVSVGFVRSVSDESVI